MSRMKFVAGNWKMFTTAETGRALARAVVRDVPAPDRIRVAVFPPFPYLASIFEVLKNSSVALGAQNVYPEPQGAFTGEVSPAMLLDVGCRWAIVGHSERRHGLGEQNEFLNRKVRAALGAGLSVIYCIGETLAERNDGRTEQVLEVQLTQGLAGLSPVQLPRLVIAYEPVWAIGTGVNATPDQAQSAHHFIRARVGRIHGEEVASRLPIQYGGSVKPENAAQLMSQPDIDGALVGGASLQADSFLAIVRAAIN